MNSHFKPIIQVEKINVYGGTLKTFLSTFFYLCFSIAVLSSCNKKEGGLLESPSRASGSIIISSQDVSHLGITRYSLDGELQEFIRHYRNVVNSYPRGLALRSDQSILVALDGEDGVEELFFNGDVSTFYASPLLSGTIYDIVMDPAENYYVIESNRIEMFDVSGNRANPTYINTSVGSCTLNSPRHMIVNSLGQLVVAQYSGTILTYDISTSTSSCVSSVAFNNNPYALAEHANGKLYVATQSDDQIYEADLDGSNRLVIWSTDRAIINNPTALAVHPDGDLLVGSSSTHTIEKIQIDGTRVGAVPYLKDIFTRNIHDILIIPEDNL